MLHSLTANKETFHPVAFHPGLNLILAKRLPNSSSVDTCNGLGKSTLIRIIDFCMGANPNTKDTLSAESLDEWEFTLELDVGLSCVKVTRRCHTPEYVIVVGDVSDWPVKPDLQLADGGFMFSIDNWRTVLGWGLFDLPIGSIDDAVDTRKPTARALLNYAIRKSYANELKSAEEGKAGPRVIALAYLFGIDWKAQCRIDHAIAAESDFKTVKSAAKIEMQQWQITKVSDLKKVCSAQAIDLEARQKTLSEFNVSEQFHQVEQHASKLTQDIHILENECSKWEYRIRAIDQSLKEESDLDYSVEDVYRAAGIEIGELVSKRLEEVKDFHARLLMNREKFLTGEKSRLESAIARVRSKIDWYERLRRKDYAILNTTKALEEFTMLQGKLSEDRSVLSRKQDCLNRYQKSNKALTGLREKKKAIIETAESDFVVKADNRNLAEERFDKICKMFYDKPGTLGISFQKKGKARIKFDPQFPKDQSDGIGCIKIFTFDLTMFEQQRKCGRRLDFWIHDSLIFDSVDARQIAKALEEADRVTLGNNTQYICAMNDDKLPRSDFSEGFDVDSKTVLSLEDGPMQNSLLGISF